MAESWLTYLLIFALLLVGIQQAQLVVARSLGDRRRTRRRFADVRDGTGQSPDLDTLRRRAEPWRQTPVLAELGRFVAQSGFRRGMPTLAAYLAVLSGLAYLVLPGTAGPIALRLPASLVAAGAILWLVLRRMRNRRMARFGEQLPEILDVITRSLRAGHPLSVSLALVARETPEPAGPEFGLLVDEISYGRSIGDALNHLHERVGYPELRFMVASMTIAQQTGGNLGEILGRLSKTLRERFRLQRRVRALSAEGRFSGYALSVLPVILFAAINLLSPGYYAEFFETSAARPIMVICLALMIVGNAIIVRLVNFRV